MLMLTLLSMLIPSYRYAIDGKLDAPLSPFKILSNGFDTARKVVFATTEQDAAELLFSQTAMAMIIAFWALFLIAFAIDTFSHPTMFFHDKEFSGNIFSMIALPLTSVMALLLLCKAIKKIPVISYIGRYSIIPLCTHHLIYRPITLVVYKFVTPEDGGCYIVALSTIVICLAIIPPMIRYIPQFTAQKDLIK